MIVELKYNETAESAIAQIKERKYIEGLKNYKEGILLVGINYDKKTREHECEIEELIK